MRVALERVRPAFEFVRHYVYFQFRKTVSGQDGLPSGLKIDEGIAAVEVSDGDRIGSGDLVVNGKIRSYANFWDLKTGDLIRNDYPMFDAPNWIGEPLTRELKAREELISVNIKMW